VAIAALLREAMQKRQVDQLFDTMGTLATARAERARRR
jgi:hypothetical protein